MAYFMNAMNDKERAQMKAWVEQWTVTGRALERIKAEELKHINVPRSIEQLDDAFNIAMRHHRTTGFSGLVEFQAWLHKSRS